MKTCYLCKGDVERAIVDYMTEGAGGFLLVKDLPVEQCTQCHEIYLDPPAARAVENARKNRAKTKEIVVVPAVSFVNLQTITTSSHVG